MVRNITKNKKNGVPGSTGESDGPVPDFFIDSIVACGVILAIQTWRKIFIEGYTLGDKPTVLAGVFPSLLGIQLFSIGLLAELVIRTYHESQGKQVYAIREVIKTT